GCVAHAATSRSVPIALAVLVVTAGLGFAVEALGVRTGVPFGHYRYTGVLGTQAFGVPLVVGPAWTMLAWPSALAARRLVADPVARVVVGAWALAAADVFLDPQLVALGAWRWADPSPHLPGVTTVPLTNYLGWLGTALVLSAVLQSFVGDGRDPDAPALALYLWLWIGWTVAQLAFLDLRPSAGWGFLAMGLVAVPLTRRLRI
ncbi:carotenoid biosynthesis protein, partial [Jatrophihabitans endophyticus]|uniref:carotenoid biosynthesis protein n=1 Tax=Jatrophihabitans endophyticus TaxID=1206085 RepID=UPI0026EFED22